MFSRLEEASLIDSLPERIEGCVGKSAAAGIGKRRIHARTLRRMNVATAIGETVHTPPFSTAAEVRREYGASRPARHARRDPVNEPRHGRARHERVCA